MFSIEYIWSAFAITQALIVTLQVGSKLLLPSPPPPSTTDGSQTPPIVVNNSTNISSEIIQRNKNTTSVTPLQKRNDDDHIDHIRIIENNENDLLLSAFRLAVRIGSLSCHHQHQMINDSHTLELELIDNDIDCNIWSHTSRSSTGSTINVRRCYREKSSPSNIEPYRMSMVPAFRLYQYPTNSTSNTTNVNAINNIATNDETQVIQTTTPGPPAIENVPNDTHFDLFHEYYETQCTLVHDNNVTKHHLNSSNPLSKPPMATTCYRIRAYAPQIFQQLRSYYDNHTTGTTGTNGSHYHRNKKLQEPLSFESSILHRSYTFLKTNSKGSQRSKNIFFYTNGTTFYRTKQVGRTNIDPSSEHVPNYLIKSIKNDEFDTLMNTILPKYVSYMKQYGTISLLNRIYGIYEITIQDDDTDPNNGQQSSLDTDGDDDTINTTTQNKRQQRYYLVVFNAVFDPSLLTNTTTSTTAATNEPHASRFRVYDVKGSTVGRQTKDSTNLTKDSPTPNQSSSSVTYKDVDLIQDIHQKYNTDESHETTNRTAANSAVRLLQLNPSTKDQILKQLRNDVNFLTSCSVMDYSLLIGMEQLRKNVVHDERHRTTQIRKSFWRKRSNRNSDRRELNTGTSPLSVHYGTRKNQSQEKYYLGVIDFLQPYNYKKEIEYRWKSLIHKKNAYSCIPPDLYAKRFLDFIDEYVM